MQPTHNGQTPVSEGKLEVRHAVPIALHLDAAVLGDTPAEFLLRHIRRLALQGHQRTGLIPRKAQQ